MFIKSLPKVAPSAQQLNTHFLLFFLPQSSENKWNHKLLSRDILICGMTELPRLESRAGPAMWEERAQEEQLLSSSSYSALLKWS